MYNINLLIKNYFKSYIGSFSKKTHKGKILFGIFLISIFSLLIFTLLGFNSYVSINELIKLSPNDYKFANFAVIINLVTLLMIVIISAMLKANSNSKDNDLELLLSMPFKKQEIVISKSIVNYIIDFFLFLGIFLPSMIIYKILVKNASGFIILRSFILLLFLPILANGITKIISFILNKLERFKKLKNFLVIFFQIVLISLVLGFNFYLNNIFTNNNELDINNVLKKLFLIKFLFNFLMNNNLLHFIFFLVITFIIFSLGVFLETKMLTKNNQYFKLTKNNEFKKKSEIIDLLKIEGKRYSSSSLYLINSIFGLFLLIASSIYIIIMGKDFF